MTDPERFHRCGRLHGRGFLVVLFCCLWTLCSIKYLAIEREEPTQSKDQTYRASSSLNPPHEGDYRCGDKRQRGNDNEDLNSKVCSSPNPGGDYEGRDEQQKGNINEDLNSKASSSSTPPYRGDYEGGDEQMKGNDNKDLNSNASSSSNPPHGGDYEGGHKQQRGNNYEVFLSFSGKDTRKGFTNHLYSRLSNAGILVFIDKNNLPVGEAFGPELIRTITRSKISIPIISENYTFSKWCLRELVQMLKCRRNGGQKMMPIFYKVKPSQVRYLKGRLRDAFIARNESVDGIDFKEWEDALEEVSKLEARESEEIDNGHEGTLVEKIFREVRLHLKRLFQLNVSEQLVGIDDRVEQIMRLIDDEFNRTRIIGIYGMGGIGKTTLAKVLYNRLSRRFYYRSFVADIRETSQRKGIYYVQNQLISALIENFDGMSNVEGGIGVIKSLIKNKNVLIFFDDMDDDTHLNALVGDGSWYSSGSVIIITTRNKNILDKIEASPMYQVDQLPSDVSLILFSRHAFRKDSPPSDYEVISRDIVSSTAGLPLALEVIGAFLCGKKMEVWKSTSEKLKEIPDTRVKERLKISYDGLDFEDQQIFLDIACFFIGSSQQMPTYMWDACGFFPGKGIEVLRLMSLIKIDKYGKLLMHDQLRDLGRDIVRLENPDEPQKRSRLWNHEEVVEMLDRNQGTSMIKALRLEKYDQRSYTSEQFKKLTNLRFLQVNGANLTGDFRNLLPQLRWLWWERYPSDFAATNFYPKKLVALDLSRGMFSDDWGGWALLKMATNLKVLHLSDCKFLRRTPDLSALKSLEILNLEACTDLREIHPSLGDIKTLISLNLKFCSITEIPEAVGRMKELKELILFSTMIQRIPIAEGCLMKLETLDATNCERLDRLPESMGSLVSLSKLNLDRCPIEWMPSSIGRLPSLQQLSLHGCRRLRMIPDWIGQSASLTELDLIGIGILELPERIGNLQRTGRGIYRKLTSQNRQGGGGNLEATIEHLLNRREANEIGR